MSQDLDTVPWGAQDRFQTHYIVKTNGKAVSHEFLAQTYVKTEGNLGTKKVVGVRWFGGQLAQILNSDEELKGMITKLSYKDAHIWVEPTLTGIRIHGKWKASYELQITNELFAVYDKIAAHVRLKLGSPPI